MSTLRTLTLTQVQLLHILLPETPVLERPLQEYNGIALNYKDEKRIRLCKPRPVCD